MTFFRPLASFGIAGAMPGAALDRSFLDTARLALSSDGAAGLAQGLAVSAVAGTADLVASAAQLGMRIAGAAREKRAYADLRRALPDHPVPFTTHPLLVGTLFDLKKEKHRVLQRLAENATAIQSYLLEPLDDLLNHYGVTMDPDLIVRRTPAEEMFFASHPLPMFDGINARGIVQYDRELFGRDALQTLAGGVKPEQTRLWTILRQIPQGGIVADWGGGAGIFAHELKLLRPDLKIYVIDRHHPAEALATSITLSADTHSPRAEDVLASFHPVIGDGETLMLPGGERADAIFSVHMSPYVDDAIGLAAHLYNQLKPGGLLVTTLSAHLFDASETWLQWYKIHKETARDLAGLGLETLSANDARTLIVRRRGDSRLKRSATLAGSFDHVDYLRGMGRRNSRLGLYAAAPQPVGRWLALDKP